MNIITKNFESIQKAYDLCLKCQKEILEIKKLENPPINIDGALFHINEAIISIFKARILTHGINPEG